MNSVSKELQKLYSQILHPFEVLSWRYRVRALSELLHQLFRNAQWGLRPRLEARGNNSAVPVRHTQEEIMLINSPKTFEYLILDRQVVL